MSLRYALLGLLSDGPASGYDLLRTFKHSLANVWPATQSQIYTELTKLADAGLIEVSDEGPRGRKEYTLTDTGLDDLRTWLTTTEPKQAVRNEALLRIFFLGVIPREQAHAYLAGMEERSDQAHEELRELERAIDWNDSDLSRYGRIALEYGERITATNREWARWALEQLPPEDE
ncbi:PadR family transcriptional regulator [Nocardia seriolae]|nr:PadR family transcriptional regulator [Nocardia seriolae]APA98983.1 Negative transcription regulator PadR [Nocardia seriolae]MTJ64033.1 PadR family transcriptional regulator [Nocardia seriolae]MTJ71299.1 PadR family transcriptional regulator [Nocardia seriolae]MTJ88594.1 PadR family transcriptional regulator [Nocardia seriolae]MTK32578.1 PadR family transcriptional regulator [Nocardia seriolae]